MYIPGKIPHGPPPTSELWSSEFHQYSDIGSPTSFSTLDHLLPEAHHISHHTGDSTKLFSSVQFRSVTCLCPTLCGHRMSMNCSIPGFPVHHHLLEVTQTHVHWVSDANQPSHPLLSPSPPAFNLSQNQGLFQWVTSLQQVAKVLEFQLQH